MTSTARPQIVYIGAFRLPDRNAAAQRVLAIAKGLRSLGHDVVLAETGHPEGRGGSVMRLPDYEGFTCYRLPMTSGRRLNHPQVSIRQVKDLLLSLDQPRAVIAYNYPAIGLARLLRFCHRQGIICAADATEWYGTRHISAPVAAIAKWIDTTARMRLIHRRLDALLVISSRLEQFYRRGARPTVVRIPPLVDVRDQKWHFREEAKFGPQLSLVFAGSVGAEKERLDLTVAAVSEVAKSMPVHLDVVGITADQFKTIYPDAPLPSSETVTFHGRLSHSEALAQVARADYSVIAREQSRVTESGFPTKFVESVTLGTPVLTTPHPDLSLILADGRNGAVLALKDLATDLVSRASEPRVVDKDLFDISRYSDVFKELAAALGMRR